MTFDISDSKLLFESVTIATRIARHDKQVPVCSCWCKVAAAAAAAIWARDELTSSAVSGHSSPLMTRCGTLKRPRLAGHVAAHFDCVVRHFDDVCPISRRWIGAAEHFDAHTHIPRMNSLTRTKWMFQKAFNARNEPEAFGACSGDRAWLEVTSKAIASTDAEGQQRTKKSERWKLTSYRTL